jgi:hypothetical protein
MDDQPVWLRTRAGPILSVPYPIELNDAQLVIHRKQDAAAFCDMIVDQFDEMIEQCERHPLVMNVSVHTYVFGQPFRLRRLRAALKHCQQHERAGRVWWTRCNILRGPAGGRDSGQLIYFAAALNAFSSSAITGSRGSGRAASRYQ